MCIIGFIGMGVGLLSNILNLSLGFGHILHRSIHSVWGSLLVLEVRQCFLRIVGGILAFRILWLVFYSVLVDIFLFGSIILLLHKIWYYYDIVSKN
jgi:hypothetical protein